MTKVEKVPYFHLSTIIFTEWIDSSKFMHALHSQPCYSNFKYHYQFMIHFLEPVCLNERLRPKMRLEA